MAMDRIAITASSGLMVTGAATSPTKAVNTTSDMTRGFSRAKKSPAVASDMRKPASSINGLSTRAMRT